MKTVLVRIKRFGKMFATCGIPLRPPADMIGKPGAKRLCPKLVPGQVVELPADHSILNQVEMVEVVRRVQDDEIKRPWVFKTAEDAAMANPSRRGKFTDEQIAESLAMAEGAVANADKHREVARSKHAEKEDDEDGYDEDEVPLESEAKVAARSRNRQTRDVYEDAKPPEDDEPAQRSRTPRAERARRRA